MDVEDDILDSLERDAGESSKLLEANAQMDVDVPENNS